MEVAAKSPELNEAGSNLAKSAKTVTAFVNNCLLPLAAVNYGFQKGKDYFENKFAAEISEKVKEVPVENLVEPRPSVAAPILQALTFAHSEEELKQMFLNLLKTSMDNRVAAQAHPFFADAIRQITSQEARLLTGVLAAESLPIIRIVVYNGNPRSAVRGFNHIGYHIAATNIMGLMDEATGEPVAVFEFPAMVENWIRLGFVEVTYEEKIISGDNYQWVKRRPEYLDAINKHNPEFVVVNEGIIRATPFGAQFKRAVT